MISAGVAFAPTGVPLGVFSEAEPSKIPPTLLSAAKFERLRSYAVSLAVRDSVDRREPGMPQPETLLTYVRGRLFSGEEQMTAFALEQAHVTRRIQGWKTAANECFGKSPEELSLAEAAILIFHIRSPSTVWDERDDELLERRNAFLRRMAENEYATTDDVAVAMLTPVVFCKVES